MKEKIIVYADPDIGEIIPGFLENRNSDIDKYLKALEQNDFETIRILGHSMKGSGAGYGFDVLTDIGSSIEKAAKKEEGPEIEALVEELKDYLERLEVKYEEE